MAIQSVSSQVAMEAALLCMDGPFSRRSSDCWRTAARTFEHLFGVDPMGPHTYSTIAEAKAIIREGGGPLECCEYRAGRAGLVEAEPAPGLIGMVKTDGQDFDWSGGICIEPNVWAVKGRDGVFFLPEYIKCWGLA